MVDESSPSPGEGYPIGVVARLTGIAEHNLRSWEKRYGFPRPTRQGRQRHYSEDQLRRLQLVRDLLERGESIGVLAPLSLTALQQRLQRWHEVSLSSGSSALDALSPASPRSSSSADEERHRPLSGPLQIAWVGEPDPGLDALDLRRETALTWHRVETLEALPSHCDLVLLVVSSAGPEQVAHWRQQQAEKAFRSLWLLYRYAPEQTLQRVNWPGFRAFRRPLEARGFEAALRGHLQELGKASPPSVPKVGDSAVITVGEAPAPRYTLAQLLRLAELSSNIACECPSHLSRLLLDLQAFERYSRECQNRDAADAAFHARLGAVSSRIRGELEEVLDELIRLEGWEGRL